MAREPIHDSDRWFDPDKATMREAPEAEARFLAALEGHFIDMFPVWDTLSANKMGRCPKWPRPK